LWNGVATVCIVVDPRHLWLGFRINLPMEV